MLLVVFSPVASGWFEGCVVDDSLCRSCGSDSLSRAYWIGCLFCFGQILCICGDLFFVLLAFYLLLLFFLFFVFWLFMFFPLFGLVSNSWVDVPLVIGSYCCGLRFFGPPSCTG